MAKHTLVKKCTVCGFLHSMEATVYGEFDGWSENDKRMDPEYCPFCCHAEKLGMTADITKLAQVLKYVKDSNIISEVVRKFTQILS